MVYKERDVISGSEKRDVEALIAALGGRHAALEAITLVLTSDGRDPTRVFSEADENTHGFCYLRLFDRVEHRDALQLGYCPDVVALRRFSNGRSDPFGSRSVSVKISLVDGQRLAHVEYCSGTAGLRPVSALAALAKDVKVGVGVPGYDKSLAKNSLPDGVGVDFPPAWIPAKHHVVVCYNWAAEEVFPSGRNFDLYNWGKLPVDKYYEDMISPYTKLKWSVIADPLSNGTGVLHVTDAHGKIYASNSWSSYVGENAYHKDFRVRGHKVFVRLELWRPARFINDEKAPLPPKPTVGSGIPGGSKNNSGHGELFKTLFVRTSGGAAVPGLDGDVNSDAQLRSARGFNFSGQADPDRVNALISAPDVTVGVVTSSGVTKHPDGVCYLNLFDGAFWHVAFMLLKTFPTVGQINAFIDGIDEGVLNVDAVINNTEKTWILHAEPDGDGDKFYRVRYDLNQKAMVGSTQSGQVDALVSDGLHTAPALSLRPRGNGMQINVPFSCILDNNDTAFYWNLRTNKKLAGLSQYFESVELEALSITATVVGGDSDTLLSIAIDTDESAITTESGWAAANRSLFLSGNTNGATVGTIDLNGDHGFGRQIKGAVLGNATPVVQAALDTSVQSRVFVKANLVLRVTGAGKPRAAAMPVFKRTQSGSPRNRHESEE